MTSNIKNLYNIRCYYTISVYELVILKSVEMKQTKVTSNTLGLDYSNISDLNI